MLAFCICSSEGSDKVVICNIHVLYNPRRGEIKLGQVFIFDVLIYMMYGLFSSNNPLLNIVVIKSIFLVHSSMVFILIEFITV